MKHKDISFNKEMILAVRENRKTVTRRIIKKVPPNTESIERHSSSANGGLFVADPGCIFIKCSYTIGTILTVREDNDLLLRVTAVSAERVQDITESDCSKEGVFVSGGLYRGTKKENGCREGYSNPINAFKSIWDSCYDIDGRRWPDNPFVWVVEFQRIK